MILQEHGGRLDGVSSTAIATAMVWYDTRAARQAEWKWDRDGQVGPRPKLASFPAHPDKVQRSVLGSPFRVMRIGFKAAEVLGVEYKE